MSMGSLLMCGGTGGTGTNHADAGLSGRGWNERLPKYDQRLQWKSSTTTRRLRIAYARAARDGISSSVAVARLGDGMPQKIRAETACATISADARYVWLSAARCDTSA